MDVLKYPLPLSTFILVSLCVTNKVWVMDVRVVVQLRAACNELGKVWAKQIDDTSGPLVGNGLEFCDYRETLSGLFKAFATSDETGMTKKVVGLFFDVPSPGLDEAMRAFFTTTSLQESNVQSLVAFIVSFVAGLFMLTPSDENALVRFGAVLKSGLLKPWVEEVFVLQVMEFAALSGQRIAVAALAHRRLFKKAVELFEATHVKIDVHRDNTAWRAPFLNALLFMGIIHMADAVFDDTHPSKMTQLETFLGEDGFKFARAFAVIQAAKRRRHLVLIKACREKHQVGIGAVPKRSSTEISRLSELKRARDAELGPLEEEAKQSERVASIGISLGLQKLVVRLRARDPLGLKVRGLEMFEGPLPGRVLSGIASTCLSVMTGVAQQQAVDPEWTVVPMATSTAFDTRLACADDRHEAFEAWMDAAGQTNLFLAIGAVALAIDDASWRMKCRIIEMAPLLNREAVVEPGLRPIFAMGIALMTANVFNRANFELVIALAVQLGDPAIVEVVLDATKTFDFDDFDSLGMARDIALQFSTLLRTPPNSAAELPQWVSSVVTRARQLGTILGVIQESIGYPTSDEIYRGDSSRLCHAITEMQTCVRRAIHSAQFKEVVEALDTQIGMLGDYVALQPLTGLPGRKRERSPAPSFRFLFALADKMEAAPDLKSWITSRAFFEQRGLNWDIFGTPVTTAFDGVKAMAGAGACE